MGADGREHMGLARNAVTGCSPDPGQTLSFLPLYLYMSSFISQ